VVVRTAAHCMLALLNSRPSLHRIPHYHSSFSSLPPHPPPPAPPHLHSATPAPPSRSSSLTQSIILTCWLPPLFPVLQRRMEAYGEDYMIHGMILFQGDPVIFCKCYDVDALLHSSTPLWAVINVTAPVLVLQHVQILQLTARACMLQPPLGGQAATPSTQLPRPLPRNGF
jgi:hypothetical protein